MNPQQRSLRAGIAALLIALVFRFLNPGVLSQMLYKLRSPDTVAFLIYAETGRRVQFSEGGEILPEQIEVPALSLPGESSAPRIEQPVIPVFSDSSLVELTYACSYRPDVEALLKTPLSWQLRGEEPRVLIYHTHTTESYRKGAETYEETAAYRTLDPH